MFMWEKAAHVAYVEDWIETAMQKTSIGITLTKNDWKQLIESMKYLSQMNEDIRNEPLCAERLDHLNQVGYWRRCKECSPFLSI